VTNQKNIFVINGSASAGSSNQKLIDKVAEQLSPEFHVIASVNLKTLPHFDPQLSDSNPPASIVELRKQIEQADGVLICTPEYVFSIPSGLKNVIEWCVSTVVFTDKPTGIITASASGQKGHEELKLIMKTVMAKFTDETTWLIPGVKGKVNERGEITNDVTKQELKTFVEAFKSLVISKS
jgi:chromate reductase, NAD(P)H dehydrogenase (quinone)